MPNILFIDGAENQWTIHWLGIPYLVESSFNGRFYNVLDMEEESVDRDTEGKVLDKFFYLHINKVTASQH